VTFDVGTLDDEPDAPRWDMVMAIPSCTSSPTATRPSRGLRMLKPGGHFVSSTICLATGSGSCGPSCR
jgi:hypothetical protein